MSPIVVGRRWFSLLALLLLIPVVHSLSMSPAPPVRPYERTAVLYASDHRWGDLFGRTIVGADDFVGAGDFAAVGAPFFTEGAVYLFRGEPGNWRETGRLSGPPGVQTWWFGGRLAVDGDSLAVAMGIVDTSQKKVYVYQHVPPDWQLQPVPTPSWVWSFPSLALDGDTLAVGAVDYAPAIYVFTRVGGQWSEQARVPAPPDSSEAFGVAVALAGNWLLVGDPHGTGSAADDLNGRVYVYHRDGDQWTAAGVLQPGSGHPDDWFGEVLALDRAAAPGDTPALAVAACSIFDHSGANSLTFFSLSSGVWTETAALPLPANTNLFTCNSLDFAGTRVVLAAGETFDPYDPRFPGAAFLFEQQGGVWELAQVLRPSDIQPGDGYAASAALAGADVLVGADEQGRLNAGYRGAVHVFSPRPAGGGLALLPLLARSELSPGDARIAYQAIGTGGAYDIFVSNLSGSGRTNLTRTLVNEWFADWSADGRELVWARELEDVGSSELVILTLSTGETRVLPIPLRAISHPRWSPDGQTIAFDTTLFTGWELYVIGRDGQGLVNLTAARDNHESQPAWSPDGTQIVYRADDGLWIMNADGTDRHYLAGSPADVWGPDWSPDGQTILYLWPSGVESGLYTIPAAGGTPRHVLADVWSARWSPDGRTILFGGNSGGVFRVDPDGRNLTVIDPGKSIRNPAERP